MAKRGRSTEGRAPAAAAGPAPDLIGWVQPLPFERVGRAASEKGYRLECARALRVLRRVGLSNAGIRQLVRGLRVARESVRVEDSWPSLAEDRDALAALANRARALKAALDELSPRARAQLATGTLQSVGDAALPERLRTDLQFVEMACLLRVRAMPSQSRERNHASVVEAVRTAVAPFGVAPGRGGRFQAACDAAFVLCDFQKITKGRAVRVTSEGSIKAHRNNRAKY